TELLEPDARFEAELGQAAAADRVAVQVFGTELLVAVPPDRSAAAAIKAAGGRDIEQAGAEDCPQPDAARDHDIVADRVVSAGVDLGAAVAESPAVEGQFGTEAAAQAKAAGGVEQAVAAVITRRQGHR